MIQAQELDCGIYWGAGGEGGEGGDGGEGGEGGRKGWGIEPEQISLLNPLFLFLLLPLLNYISVKVKDGEANMVRGRDGGMYCRQVDEEDYDDDDPNQFSVLDDGHHDLSNSGHLGHFSSNSGRLDNVSTITNQNPDYNNNLGVEFDHSNQINHSGDHHNRLDEIDPMNLNRLDEMEIDRFDGRNLNRLDEMDQYHPSPRLVLTQSPTETSHLSPTSTLSPESLRSRLGEGYCGCGGGRQGDDNVGVGEIDHQQYPPIATLPLHHPTPTSLTTPNPHPSLPQSIFKVSNAPSSHQSTKAQSPHQSTNTQISHQATTLTMRTQTRTKSIPSPPPNPPLNQASHLNSNSEIDTKHHPHLDIEPPHNDLPRSHFHDTKKPLSPTPISPFSFSSPLTKMMIGFSFAAISYLCAAMLDFGIIRAKNHIDPNTQLPQKLSIFWQVPQYFFITLAEVFVSVTGLTFVFDMAPGNMKSLVTALYLFSGAIGDVLTGLFFTTFEALHFTRLQMFLAFSVSIMINSIAIVVIQRMFGALYRFK